MKAAAELKKTMARLRAPGGCSWDRALTISKTTRYLIEEVSEVVEAIDNNDVQNLQEELGDLITLVIIICVIAEEEGTFNFEQVLEAANKKIIRRHPHVFENPQDLSPEAVLAQMADIKAQEKPLESFGKKALPKFLKKHASALHMAWDACKHLHKENALQSFIKSEQLDLPNSPELQLGQKLLQVVAEHYGSDIDPETALRTYIREQLTIVPGRVRSA
jgi:uncharacterized protein YabN with tetrapyrrole methylase and pyrophosphatase domain